MGACISLAGRLRMSQNFMREKREKSSIRSVTEDEDYRYVDGRQFHKNILYMYPVDSLEAMRLKLIYLSALNAWKSHFSSPVKETLLSGNARVLDLGCGTGAWTFEMARAYDQVQFTGVDISPMFPVEDAPSNVEFRQLNILDRLPFEDESFDFIVIHVLGSAFTIRQWETIVLPQVVRLLKPGGWFEWMEIDSRFVNMGRNTERLLAAKWALMNSRGISPMITVEIPKLLFQSKMFHNVYSGKRPMRVGKWAGEYGRMFLEAIVEKFSAMKNPNLEFMSATSEEYDMIVQKFCEEVEEHQTYANLYRFCSQKVYDERIRTLAE